jgi:hypothetical protein
MRGDRHVVSYDAISSNIDDDFKKLGNPNCGANVKGTSLFLGSLTEVVRGSTIVEVALTGAISRRFRQCSALSSARVTYYLKTGAPHPGLGHRAVSPAGVHPHGSPLVE